MSFQRRPRLVSVALLSRAAASDFKFSADVVVAEVQARERRLLSRAAASDFKFSADIVDGEDQGSPQQTATCTTAIADSTYRTRRQSGQTSRRPSGVI
jgi:hypothetical protein